MHRFLTSCRRSAAPVVSLYRYSVVLWQRTSVLSNFSRAAYFIMPAYFSMHPAILLPLLFYIAQSE